MKKRYYAILLLILLLFGSQWMMRDYQKIESSIFYNGKILTMENLQDIPEAIFVEKGIIKSIGKKDEIFKLKNNKTQLVDLKGKTLLPGFIDPHTHPAISTFLHSMVDLSGFTHETPSELWSHLSKELPKFKAGEWIICKGFDPILVKGLEAPHINFLDSIAPNNPLLIISQSLHSFWANTAAFQQVNISKETPDPNKTSFYERDQNGDLTGFIAETVAFDPFTKKIEEIFTPSQMIASTDAVFKEYAKMGNTTIVTTGLTILDAKPLQLYEHLSAGEPKFLNQLLASVGYFPKRSANVRHFIYVRHDRDFLLPESSDNGDDFYKIIGIKHWYDGSPYTGSMFLNAPYEVSDLTIKGFRISEGYSGKRLLEKEELASFIEKYQSQGWQVAVHVQGDRAFEESLEAFEIAHKKQSITSFRHRLEHCLLLPQEALEQVSNLNITPSIHINHLYYYGEALKQEIIGEERGEKILPVASLAKNRIKFSLHADQPMFKSDPFHLMQTAVLRKTKEGNMIGQNESISIEQALRAMTIDAAWQIKMEDKIGSIKVGKYADLVILDQNPLEVAVDDLRKIKVLKTIVNGNEIEF